MIYNVYNYDFTTLLNTPCLRDKRGNKGSKKRIVYKDLICAFDIETTRIENIDQSVMYIWQFAVKVNDKIDVIIGRTWKEFKKLINILNEDDTEGKYLIFVHNLSYEFQFLRNVYNFNSEEVFAVKSRKILKCEMYNKFEFRCSYLQTNLSLANFTAKMGVENKKIKGYDYYKKRYYFTPMSDDEMNYCINDVVGLIQAIEKRMSMYNDTLYTLPLTSTGYVRRVAKKKMIKWANYNRAVFPTIGIFDLLEEAFRGGDTHANRYYVGKKIKNVVSYDRSSSYPDVIVNCKYPYRFYRIDKSKAIESIENGKAVLMRIVLQNVKQKDKFYGCPYISFSKCRKVKNKIEDNGRIISADYLETTITDIDYKILIKEYDFEITVIEAYSANYGMLPKNLRDVVIKFFVDKTSLKNVEGQDVFYMNAKELLNAIYGMMVQSPCKDNILFTEGAENIFSFENVSRETLLNEYNKKAFLPYQWGVWVTAWARYRLKEVVNIVGDNFVYCDTDSVKFVYNDEIINNIQSYNEYRYNDSLKSGAYAKDSKGLMHYMGVYELDGEYKEFKTLGAKKYVYTDKQNNLHTTIAGVNKKLAPIELKEHGGLDSFKVGFVFNIAGGTESIYNDADYGYYKLDDEHTIFIGKNMCIKNSTYTLGLTEEYTRLLSTIETYSNYSQYINNLF